MRVPTLLGQLHFVLFSHVVSFLFGLDPCHWLILVFLDVADEVPMTMSLGRLFGENRSRRRPFDASKARVALNRLGVMEMLFLLAVL